VKTRSVYGTFVELRKFRFLTHVFQDPPLCSSVAVCDAKKLKTICLHIQKVGTELIYRSSEKYSSDDIVSLKRNITTVKRNSGKDFETPHHVFVLLLVNLSSI
jgi:hypothetical protein